MTREQKEIAQVKGWDEGAVEAYISLGTGDDALENFEEAYQGEWPNDEDFVMNLLGDTGDIPKDLPPYVHIDEEWTAREVMMDYSEEKGHYFRNL